MYEDQDHPYIKPNTEWIDELLGRGKGDYDMYLDPHEDTDPKVPVQNPNTYSTLDVASLLSTS